MDDVFARKHFVDGFLKLSVILVLTSFIQMLLGRMDCPFPDDLHIGNHYILTFGGNEVRFKERAVGVPYMWFFGHRPALGSAVRSQLLGYMVVACDPLPMSGRATLQNMT